MMACFAIRSCARDSWSPQCAIWQCEITSAIRCEGHQLARHAQEVTINLPPKLGHQGGKIALFEQIRVGGFDVFPDCVFDGIDILATVAKRTADLCGAPQEARERVVDA